MIRKIQQGQEELLQSCSEKSTEKAFSCRIRSLLSAYGPEMSFVGFWVQKIDGENKAMISRLDNSFVLAAQAGADFSELAEFFSLFAGTPSLFKSGS